VVQTIRLSREVHHGAVSEATCGGPVEMVVVLPAASASPVIGSDFRVSVGNCRQR
jgi:hypothetical protein